MGEMQIYKTLAALISSTPRPSTTSTTKKCPARVPLASLGRPRPWEFKLNFFWSMVRCGLSGIFFHPRKLYVYKYIYIYMYIYVLINMVKWEKTDKKSWGGGEKFMGLIFQPMSIKAGMTCEVSEVISN